MEQKIIALETPGLFLNKTRGFLQAQKDGEVIAKVSLDELAALVVNAHALSYTNSLVVSLAERNVPIVLCGKNHLPAATVLPVVSNFKQAKYLKAQAALSKPRSKQIWAAVVKSKISWQAFTLEQFDRNSKSLQRMGSLVKSGDPTNIEAQAARFYWKKLMGTQFRRDVACPGENQLLNYGYTILRASVCRALMSAGLNPGFGVHHCSETNPMQLVDDLMEPFRPLIDLRVRKIVDSAGGELTREAKQDLAGTMQEPVPGNGSGPLMNHIYRIALDYRAVIIGEIESLGIPHPVKKKPPKSAMKKPNAPKRLPPNVAVSNV